MLDNKLSQTTPPSVRFASSPAGYLLVGGARMALFNWLFAHHTGGTVILHIGDTGFERVSAVMVDGTPDGVRGLGPTSADGPFHQSKRLELYKKTAAQWLC